MQKYLLIYVVVINILTYAVFGWDKYKAKRGAWRISEKSLLFLCAIGGASGGLIAMNAFKHKRQKVLFKVLVPLLLVAHVFLAGYISRGK